MSRFLDAAHRLPVDATPVWLMRQAGRSLPEYRALREKWTLADIVAQPELCAEVTLQPVRRLGVDAAVMFADIMLPLQGMGVEFELVENVGPVITNPTLASYLIEGKPSRDFAKVKTFMYTHPAEFDLLLAKLAATMAAYLQAQVAAGVSAVQLFDSWVGALAREDYRERVEPHTTAIFESLASLEVPRIHFGTNTVGLLGPITATGPDIVSLDWRVPLDIGWRMVGFDRGIQGNLDPAVLLGPKEFVRSRARDVLRRAGGRPGHIFNLGHGVHPATPLENLQALVETVHEWQVARVA